MADEPKTDTFTYERLFEILRSEKNSPNLQKLDQSYFELVTAYLDDKQRQVYKSMQSENVFANDDAEQMQTQLRNAKRIVRMIYDLREKKITQMALNKSRTASNLIDTSNLLPSEITLFKETLDVLDKFRHELIVPLIETKRTAQPTIPAATQPKAENNVLVRFLDDVPVLVGPDLKEYGPYRPEDIANVPAEVADALITGRKAQKIEAKVM